MHVYSLHRVARQGAIQPVWGTRAEIWRLKKKVANWELNNSKQRRKQEFSVCDNMLSIFKVILSISSVKSLSPGYC